MNAFVHVHRVRFDEIDAAGIVYFARFFAWCHDAMEAMLAPIGGGYAHLVGERRLGLPAVHVEADFRAPMRFGDEARVETWCDKLGNSSVALRFEVKRASDGSHVATIRHVVALTDLTAMRARPLPDDVRAALERHFAR